MIKGDEDRGDEWMDYAVKTTGLTKKVKGKNLVENVDLHIRKGEIYGFLGQNGAGKTTIMKLLTGIMTPTSGEIELFGQRLTERSKSVLKRVGSIIEYPIFFEHLTAIENLKLHCKYLGYYDEQGIKQALDMVHLKGIENQYVKEFSLGMKQRLGIAQALLGNPQLLILDEPTNGLGPSGIRELREFVRYLVETEGISVFISSHLLSEIQLMCDRVAIINKGKMITVSTVKDLLDHSRDRVEWKVTPIKEAYDLLKTKENIQDLQIKDNLLICSLQSDLISTYNRLLIENGIDVHSVYEKTLTLEDLFMELTGGKQS